MMQAHGLIPVGLHLTVLFAAVGRGEDRRQGRRRAGWRRRLRRSRRLSHVGRRQQVGPMSGLRCRRSLQLSSHQAVCMVTDVLAVSQSLSTALAIHAPRYAVLGTRIYLGGRSIFVSRYIMAVG